jgi:hypothetical protein
MCCLFSLADSRLNIYFYLMASFPRMTNEGTPFPREPFVFPSYINIGPPHIATLSLPGLTIGLSVRFFSTQVIWNAASVLVVRTFPQEHQPHVDPSPSSTVRSSSPSSLARCSSISSSLPSEISKASNSGDKKNKNKQGSTLPTTARHVGKQPIIDNHAGSVDDVKITQTTHKHKYPCRLCNGSHLLKDFLGLSKVIEAWSTHPFQPVSSSSEQHANNLPLTSQNTVGKNKSIVNFLCILCKGSHLTHLCPCMDEASKLLEDMTISLPQLPTTCHKLSLNPLVVDGMINLVPPSVSPVDQVVNLAMSLVEITDQVVDLISSSVDPTLLL